MGFEEQVLKRLDRIENKLDNQGDFCEHRLEFCTSKVDKKANASFFKWIIGLIVIAILGIGGLSAKTQTDVAIVKKDVIKMEGHINNIKTQLEDSN